MTYYVRYEDGAIDGDFTVEHIRNLVATSKLTLNAGVVEARGQGLAALRKLTEWASVSQLLADSDAASRLSASQVNQSLPEAGQRPAGGVGKWVSGICWTVVGLFAFVKFVTLQRGLTTDWLDFTNPSTVGLLATLCAVTLVIRRLNR